MGASEQESSVMEIMGEDVVQRFYRVSSLVHSNILGGLSICE